MPWPMVLVAMSRKRRRSEQTKSPTEEMRDKSAFPCAPACSVLQPWQIIPGIAAMIVFLPAKGGLPTMHRSQDFPGENFRIPSANESGIECSRGRDAAAASIYPIPLRDVESNSPPQALLFARLRLVRGKEGRNHASAIVRIGASSFQRRWRAPGWPASIVRATEFRRPLSVLHHAIFMSWEQWQPGLTLPVRRRSALS